MSPKGWKKYYQKNKEAVKARTKAWRKKNPERVRQHQRDRNARARIKVLSWYSKGVPRCACCGEKNIGFLSVDHVNGKSKAERMECGINFYYRLIREGFKRKDLQVLCYNCNCSRKNFGGKCPHVLQSAGAR